MSTTTSETPSNQTTNSNIAWVAGASGLIGKELVKQLCCSSKYSQVIAFVRTPSSLGFDHPKLTLHTCAWDSLLQEETATAPGEHVDALFCALGSTTKKTPDKDLYRKIDVEYPEAFAKLGKKHGARFYGLVSANGASSKLPSFYLSMKKDVEQRIRACDYANIAIARPSLLLGERNEFRLAEKASEFFCKLLPGNMKAIHAKDVAAALINESLSHAVGCRILESAQMQGAAR